MFGPFVGAIDLIIRFFRQGQQMALALFALVLSSVCETLRMKVNFCRRASQRQSEIQCLSGEKFALYENCGTIIGIDA